MPAKKIEAKIRANIKKKKKSFNRAWSIEQIQYLSHLSIPSHSTTTPAQGDFNMRGIRARPLFFCPVVCRKHTGSSACISAWHERPGRSAPVKKFYSVVGHCDWIFIWARMHGCDEVVMLQRRWDLFACFTQFACSIIFSSKACVESDLTRGPDTNSTLLASAIVFHFNDIICGLSGHAFWSI